jgi:hypothetical protein
MAKQPRGTKSENEGQDTGPLEPRPGDTPIEKTDTPESIWADVLLTCDDDTGVFFFRHKRKMYRRVIEFS